MCFVQNWALSWTTCSSKDFLSSCLCWHLLQSTQVLQDSIMMVKISCRFIFFWCCLVGYNIGRVGLFSPSVDGSKLFTQTPESVRARRALVDLSVAAQPTAQHPCQPPRAGSPHPSTAAPGPVSSPSCQAQKIGTNSLNPNPGVHFPELGEFLIKIIFFRPSLYGCPKANQVALCFLGCSLCKDWKLNLPGAGSWASDSAASISSQICRFYILEKALGIFWANIQVSSFTIWSSFFFFLPT